MVWLFGNVGGTLLFASARFLKQLILIESESNYGIFSFSVTHFFK